jgi:hypothetical protein
MFFEVVMAYDKDGKSGTTGVYVGDDVGDYMEAAGHSLAQNVNILDKPLKKVVAIMQGQTNSTAPGSPTSLLPAPAMAWPTAANS